MCYTYVLYSKKDGNFYIGFTQDLKLRFDPHNKGRVKSTKGRRPFKLIYYEACFSRNDASHREKYLKTYHGKAYIIKRLKSFLTGFTQLNAVVDISPTEDLTGLNYLTG
jgi:putative endonuclease